MQLLERRRVVGSQDKHLSEGNAPLRMNVTIIASIASAVFLALTFGITHAEMHLALLAQP
jgi:hypothetical protein